MTSLFANLNNTQNSNYSGLFGGTTTSTSTPATTTTAGASSIFSSPPATSTGGGLFPSANGPAQASGGSNLFGALNTNTNTTTQPAQQPGGSVFSGAGTSSLFPSLNTTSQPQQTTTTGTTGLFGSLGAGTQAQPQPAAASSLFGKPATTSQQSASTSLFAGMPSTSRPAANSLFNNPATTQQPAGSSFVANLGSSIQQQQGGLGASQGLNAQQSDAQTAYFDSILEKSRKRAHAETLDELPQLQLGLGDLQQRIKRLGAGGQSQGADGRAHYLLAASGVNPGVAVKDLNQFTTATGRIERPRADEAPDTDVESYLANLQTQTTLSMISDGLARSVRDFDVFLEENVSMEWEAQRKRIYDHFGIKPKEITPERGGFGASAGESRSGGGFGRSRRSKAATLASSRASKVTGESVFGRSNLQKSVIGASGPVGTGHQPLFTDVEKKMEASGVSTIGSQDRSQREKQSRYADKVQTLNICRLKKTRQFPICNEFGEVVQNAGEQHGPDLVKAYRALMEIVDETPENPGTKEREFAGAYLEETPNSEQTIGIKKKIIRGGARCLEKLAFEKMIDMVSKHSKDAVLGGIPSVLSKVRAYVRLLAGKKNLYGDNSDLQQLGEDYVWAVIYYFLRTGHVHEADEYVLNNMSAFRTIDRNFAAYIHSYAESPDRRLSSDLQTRISNEYNQRLRVAPHQSVDPYRMACYKIIGRCDLRVRTLADIKQDVEDFAWVQLVLARELNRVDSMASEVYGLSEAQETIREIGNRFFAKGGSEIGSSFGAFVFLQIAVGMFEDAISYLYTYSYVDGVHLAIALDFYGLLRVSDPLVNGDELLSLSTKGLPQISFGSMVGLYTRDFRAANVSAAVDYLVLICLNKDLPGQGGANQRALCHEALRELVLESREFALLLGDMQNDGQRIRGAIEERMKLIGLEEADEFMRTITMQAASIADDNGRVTDAVLLYHLAGEYDTVMVVINRALSEAVAVPIGQEQMRIEPLKPRAEANSAQQQEQAQGAHSSLTSVDDPVTLAHILYGIYSQITQQFKSIKAINTASCRALLDMIRIKSEIEAGRWMEALDLIRLLEILPLGAQGNGAMIRNYANKFSSLSQPVASNVPNLLMWAVGCCNNQRAALANSQYGGNEGTKQQMIMTLKQNNMDLLTYTSQLRYRFSAHLHEALARAQSE